MAGECVSEHTREHTDGLRNRWRAVSKPGRDRVHERVNEFGSELWVSERTNEPPPASKSLRRQPWARSARRPCPAAQSSACTRSGSRGRVLPTRRGALGGHPQGPVLFPEGRATAFVTEGCSVHASREGASSWASGRGGFLGTELLSIGHSSRHRERVPCEAAGCLVRRCF